MTLNGRKTYIGVAVWLLATLAATWFPEAADALGQIATGGLGLAGLGLAHKVAKVAPGG